MRLGGSSISCVITSTSAADRSGMGNSGRTSVVGCGWPVLDVLLHSLVVMVQMLISYCKHIARPGRAAIVHPLP